MKKKPVVFKSIYIIILLLLPGCITYYHRLPKINGEPVQTTGSDNVFFSKFLILFTEKPDDGRVKSSNITNAIEFKNSFISSMNRMGVFRDTMKSNYTTIIDFEESGRIRKVNLFASLGTLTLIPIYDKKALNLKISIFHKSGEPVKEYNYSTGHVEWTGCLSSIIAQFLSSGSITHYDKKISYKEDSEIIFSNFLRDFNIDYNNGLYKENILSNIDQNPIIRGIATSGSFSEGFTTIQVRPGVIFKGDIKNGLPNGVGTLNDGNTTYSGYWINGKLTGKGKITYKNGSYYSGMLLDSRPNGYGKLVNGNQVTEGNWKDGNPVTFK